jgi:hypothetical protein
LTAKGTGNLSVKNLKSRQAVLDRPPPLTNASFFNSVIFMLQRFFNGLSLSIWEKLKPYDNQAAACGCTAKFFADSLTANRRVRL